MQTWYRGRIRHVCWEDCRSVQACLICCLKMLDPGEFEEDQRAVQSLALYQGLNGESMQVIAARVSAVGTQIGGLTFRSDADELRIMATAAHARYDHPNHGRW